MTDPNADQRDFWSVTAGPKWVMLQAQMDQLFQPVLDGLLDRASLQMGDAVLDVGCGTGASCLQAARLVGPGGSVVGADISQPMAELARTRLADQNAGQNNAKVLLRDVATHRFGVAQFDRVISRFGVMFFADPVAALKNIRGAMHPGATCCFAAWGAIPNNPYFTFAAQVAKTVVGAPPKTDPDAPGPFAFRDPSRVVEILERAGFAEGTCDTDGVMLDGGGDARIMAETLCKIGPAEAALRYFDADKTQRDAMAHALQGALAKFETAAGIQIPAEIQYYRAKA